ncbi:MAG: hypothetical protein ACFCU6_08485 [Balneolaceae bacterium]
MQFRYCGLLLIIFCPALLFYSGCETNLDGQLKENIPPRTFLTVDEINLEDENRLSSQINISWWGDDPDGFVVGFEVAVDDSSEANWLFTTRTDSTFLLPITPGQDFDDVLFCVRAIDNEGAKDPDPACVVFPIKNSPPFVQFLANETPPDTTFTIVSFGWQIGDPDGLQNLLKTEIALNDTTDENWIELPLPEGNDDRQFITLVIKDEDSEMASADIFLGRGFRSSDLVIEGISINGENQLFLRATDQALAVSEIESVEWFVKKQTSKILVLNDVGGITSQSALAFHLDAIQQAGLSVDVWYITDGTAGGGQKVRLSNAFPSVINPTLRKTLAQWNYIYWLSNDIDRNLTFAQDILADFFEDGGELFATMPMKQLSEEDPIFSFIPVARLAELPPIGTSFQISNGTEILPIGQGPVLRANQRITNVFPMEPIGGATPLYETDFRVRTILGTTQSFDGIEYVAIMNPEENFIFFGMDLQTVDANENIPDLLQSLLIDKLGFE